LLSDGGDDDAIEARFGKGHLDARIASAGAVVVGEEAEARSSDDQVGVEVLGSQVERNRLTSQSFECPSLCG
jgi:hypothetical protein